MYSTHHQMNNEHYNNHMATKMTNSNMNNRDDYFFCPDCYDRRYNNNVYTPQSFDNTFGSFYAIDQEKHQYNQMTKHNPYSVMHPTPNELFYAFPKGHVPKAPKNADQEGIDNILRNTIVPKKYKKKKIIKKNRNKDLTNIFTMLFLLMVIMMKY